MEESLRVSGQVWREALTRAANPADALKDGAGVASELAHLLLMPNDSQTRFKGKPSGDKKVAWTDPLALPEVKAVSRVLGCSVNDILLAAVAGALHKYLEAKGDRTKDVEVRALVPVNLRPQGDGIGLGNHFGIIAIELPVGLESPLSRLYEVHRRMAALKDSYEPPVTLGLMTALGYAPELVQDRLLDFLLGRATAVMTNVPGPRRPRYLAGARIKQVMFWVPQPGDIAMGVSILSFDGKVQFGLMTDAAVVPDPGAIVACFGPEFEKLLYFVLMEDWDLPTPKGAVKQEEGAQEPARGEPSKRRSTVKPAKRSASTS
jgi:WS/DGAT/MGAT family acyltransferase